MPLSDLSKPTRRAPCALAVGACHPTGHVGLGPALRALGALGVHPTAVVTAIRPLTALPGRLVRDQLERARVVPPDAIAVADPGDDPAGLVEALADAPTGPPAPMVIAPNAVDRHRRPRFEPAHLATLVRRLSPHAEAVVLDGDEAALLTGREAPDVRRMKDAAQRLGDFGARWVVVTGGRAEGHAIDLVWDGRDITEFGSARAAVDQQAGAGAVFAHLLVGWRARGLPFLDAVDRAKKGVGAALARVTAVGRANRVDPLADALDAFGLDLHPIEVPPDDADA